MGLGREGGKERDILSRSRRCESSCNIIDGWEEKKLRGSRGVDLGLYTLSVACFSNMNGQSVIDFIGPGSV